MTASIQGLMVLADDSPCWKLDPVEQARAACEGGASVVQLRAKRSTDRIAIQWAEAIRGITRQFAVDFFVNDRFDLALASGADGVHLGQTDLAPHRLPAHARSRLKIGRSTHTLEQATAACAEPIDYIAFGPIFGTRTKSSTTEPRGLDRLEEVVRHAHPRPVIAIGGIDLDNAAQVAATGVAGFAVISAIANATDPLAAARALSQTLKSDSEL